MIEDILSKIDFPKLLNVIAGVIAFFVAYLKILPLIPRSSNKILSDIDVYIKSIDADIENTEIIRNSIEREIRRKYKKPKAYLMKKSIKKPFTLQNKGIFGI